MNNRLIQCKDINRFEIKTARQANFYDYSKTSVWLTSMKDLSAEIPQLRQLLDKQELIRSEKFYFEVDANRYIVGRTMVKMVLSRYLSLMPGQLVIALGKKNKPYLSNIQRPVYFNLSHSGDFVVMVLGFQNDLGIDVEEIKPDFDFDGIIDKYFNENEQAVIYASGGNSHRRFYTFWTRKESLLKANGIGLINDLKLLDMTGTATILASVARKYPGWFNKNFFVQSFMPDETHAAAITSLQNNPPIEFFRFYPFP